MTAAGITSYTKELNKWAYKCNKLENNHIIVIFLLYNFAAVLQ